ncbi:TPA: LysR family transcriptional regulator [Cronobacter sakazakii]|uniref:LysR family transcriptional regulator n=1 Tax=Cronobacter sakazakii TaxID=28141 RepID=UPI0004A96E8A|nr:LysR family transcriptional regulator [Cronobacter sakazakii]EGT5206207.1 LysR family transcriptional regulator [Cronobacter sakazakii]EGT5649752.1 LysR family transcriptional regulator [Cronobacter sakazakii]EGT5748263.1 LysR family transcriptional regulator [Cronobacter sakazakii]EGT5751409.1 LysR family transcriptional regulator [Cronobacter sakazakii]EIZ2180801.1 LysR family transcriptional regulator [Cronobacter sakazakii]
MTGRKIASGNATGTGLDIHTLRIFVAVAEAGSFVAGGKAMGLTRSAAGKALARLEAYLETRLFQRTTRSLSLTAEGHAFYHRCCQILEDLADAESSIRQNPRLAKGILRLTVSEGYGKMIVLPFIREFLHRSPDVSIEVSFSDRVVDLVEEGFDLALRVGSGVTSYQYITQVIDRTTPQLMASPDYLQAWGMPTSLAELKNHRRLVYGLGAATTAWNFIDTRQGQIALNGRNYVRFDSGDAIRTAALMGLGIGFLPSFMVQNDIQQGRLIHVLPEAQGENVAIHAIYPNRRHLPVRVRAFIDGLKHFLSNG